MTDERNPTMRTNRPRRPPAPFNLLLGGLAASFVAATVFWTVMTPSTEAANEHAPLWATLAGLACSLLFVVAGIELAREVPWLASAVLYAAGFTALWTLPLSLTAGPRWVAALGFGTLTITCALLGFRRFGHNPDLFGRNLTSVKNSHPPVGV